MRLGPTTFFRASRFPHSFHTLYTDMREAGEALHSNREAYTTRATVRMRPSSTFASQKKNLVTSERLICNTSVARSQQHSASRLQRGRSLFMRWSTWPTCPVGSFAVLRGSATLATGLFEAKVERDVRASKLANSLRISNI
jgi:hypothetical protein